MFQCSIFITIKQEYTVFMHVVLYQRLWEMRRTQYLTIKIIYISLITHNILFLFTYI